MIISILTYFIIFELKHLFNLHFSRRLLNFTSWQNISDTRIQPVEEIFTHFCSIPLFCRYDTIVQMLIFFLFLFCYFSWSFFNYEWGLIKFLLFFNSSWQLYFHFLHYKLSFKLAFINIRIILHFFFYIKN